MITSQATDRFIVIRDGRVLVRIAPSGKRDHRELKQEADLHAANARY